MKPRLAGSHQRTRTTHPVPVRGRGTWSGTGTRPASLPRGTGQSALYWRHGMIFIVMALWIMTATIVRIRRGLTKRQAFYMFVIYLCAGIVLRSILYIFGM